MNQRKPNRTQTVVDALGRRIVSGEFAINAMFPSEPELEREYQVSRTVIREAIKILTAKGLVTVRQRHGTHVNSREYWSWLDADLIGWLSTSKLAKQELLAFSEIRQIIEPEAAALAALRGDESQKQQIVDAYHRMAQNQEAESKAVAADKAFHLAILAATGNPILLSFQKVIEAIFDALFPYTTKAFADNIENHHRVADAIYCGDAAAARQNMKELLAETGRYIEKNT